jgi:uridine kinase
MIYAIGGVSGSGKTQLRQSHEKLYNLPCIDIEVYYRAAEQQATAFTGAMRCASSLLLWTAPSARLLKEMT